ncbi:tRNA (adenosine(37)-N6)-dimethylallyltransferase MiaA [Patescibacteria group bacterium]|nr:tRNA (adenosine(37)-N6)-dimethylallyltransferase MiaA [Patescibacteria group bacterium]
MSDVQKPKAIAIVGPTASGKTALSIALAQHFNGEVISADSRQVYRGLDIGSAKVTADEMAGVPHHLIDVVEPTTVYTGADFKRDGDTALSLITARGKLPIVAGGSFFYLELLKGTMSSAPVPPNPTLRALLEQKTTAELFTELQTKDPRRAETIDPDNPRRLVRALEVIDALGVVPPVTPRDLSYDWLTIGIDVPVDVINERIHTRIIDRLKVGMIEEVGVLNKNGLSWERLEAIGLEYRYIAYYLQNKLTREEMIEQLTNKSRQFAKRQRVWLKRDHNIHWLPFPTNIEAAIGLVNNFITPTLS